MHHKIESEQPLRIGILGGSVSLYWTDRASMPLHSTFSKLLNYSKVEIYNGAIGGTGAAVPSGCLNAVFGDLVLDIVILEFAINEFAVENLMVLVEKLLYRFNNNIHIIILSITSRLMKEVNPYGLNLGLSANTLVTKRYSLIRFDWSILADKGFNITYQPYQIWSDADEQHPVLIGNDWIQYSVVATLKDIYDRPLYEPNIMTRVDISLQTPTEIRNDDFCLTQYFCNVEGHRVDNFEHYSHVEKCWRKSVKDGTKACMKMVYEDNFDSTCSNGTDHAISFMANIQRKCKLYATVVGNGDHRKPALCELDVYINQDLVHHASQDNKYLSQKTVLLLPNPLHRGLHNMTIIGRQLEVGQICNIATIFCV